jgi:hypothetical protein
MTALSRRLHRLLITFAALIVGLTPVLASAQPTYSAAPQTITVTSLTPSLPSGRKVGTTVTWTATATGGTSLEYQFSVAVAGHASIVVRDFEPANSFAWTPISEGTYRITVVVQDASAPGTTGTLSKPYSITSRIVGGQPAITPTANAMVFLYSAPPCPTGQTITATFGIGTALTQPTTTPGITCNNTTSANWYLGGMLPTTTYGVEFTVSGQPASSVMTFTTGSIPASIIQPTFSEPVPANSKTSLKNDTVVYSAAGYPAGGLQAVATNLSGKIIWYYDPANYATVGQTGYVVRPLGGQGTVLVVLAESAGANQPVREIDLAGNTLRETTLGRVNEQLAQRGIVDHLGGFHHEATRLPNGHTLLLGYIERLCPNPPGAPYTCPAAQGGTASNPVDILTDMVVDLDTNLQVAWTWNSFDHLDINRAALLGETCVNGQPGCPGAGLQLASIANDWTHENAITYSPTDHNLLVSSRHQDWIFKIDYQNGAGTGNILWKLGNQGSFTLTDATGTGGSFPYESHQHGIEVSGNGTRILTFDDGNTRCNGAPPPCDSRGQQYTINESALTATLSVNDDMGNFSFALGWAQTLRNGDFSFTSGAQGTNPVSGFGQDEEYSPAAVGTQTYVIQKNNFTYRAYRMQSMYSF